MGLTFALAHTSQGKSDTSSTAIVSRGCTLLFHGLGGILCAILCLGNESRAQRTASHSRDFTEITGFPRGAKDSAALHAHKSQTYYADSHHLRISFPNSTLWPCTVCSICPVFTIWSAILFAILFALLRLQVSELESVRTVYSRSGQCGRSEAPILPMSTHALCVETGSGDQGAVQTKEVGDDPLEEADGMLPLYQDRTSRSGSRLVRFPQVTVSWTW
jgi:hypothetical protein